MHKTLALLAVLLLGVTATCPGQSGMYYYGDLHVTKDSADAYTMAVVPYGMVLSSELELVRESETVSTASGRSFFMAQAVNLWLTHSGCLPSSTLFTANGYADGEEPDYGWFFGVFGEVGTTPPPRVTVDSASIPDDSVSVTLEPCGDSGPFAVRIEGPNGDRALSEGTLAGGSHHFSFGIPSLPDGWTFNLVRANWEPSGSTIDNTRQYHFKVLGTYIHTSYNSPAESSCTGDPSPITLYNNSCVATPDAAMKSGFISRVFSPSYGTGSGYSLNFGVVKQEFWCSPRPYPTARRDQTITGSMGPLSNSTVAVCGQSELHVAGRRVYIHGVGVKTVTDTCPACCSGTKIDHYTTSTACFVGSLPSAKTIILY